MDNNFCFLFSVLLLGGFRRAGAGRAVPGAAVGLQPRPAQSSSAVTCRGLAGRCSAHCNKGLPPGIVPEALEHRTGHSEIKALNSEALDSPTAATLQNTGSTEIKVQNLSPANLVK